MRQRRWLPRVTIVVLLAGLWPDVERIFRPGRELKQRAASSETIAK